MKNHRIDHITIDTERHEGWREYLKSYSVSVKCTVSEEAIRVLEKETSLPLEMVEHLIFAAPFLRQLAKTVCQNCSLRSKKNGMCPDCTCPIGHCLNFIGFKVKDIVTGFKE